MPLVRGLRKGVRNSGAHADQRGLLDAELACNLIRCAEANPTDVTSQPVRVLRDQSNRIGAVGLVNPYRARRADAVAIPCVIPQGDGADND